jgi:trk system potassium uptake protein TrkA
MNLPSLGFLRNIKPGSNRQFAVIGLGRFGRAVCETLHKGGYDVLGTDVDEKRVAEILTSGMSAHAIQLDSTDCYALKESGIFEFDTVIVAIGNFLQESIITTLNLKEGGVPHVVAKASSDVHAKLLSRVGADRVVLPEHEAGCALARALTRPGILDRFDLDADNSIVELHVPEAFNGKTIAELNLRSQYGLNILAMGKSPHFEINPGPNQRLKQGDMLVVIGNNDAIERLPV